MSQSVPRVSQNVPHNASSCKQNAKDDARSQQHVLMIQSLHLPPLSAPFEPSVLSHAVLAGTTTLISSTNGRWGARARVNSSFELDHLSVDMQYFMKGVGLKMSTLPMSFALTSIPTCHCERLARAPQGRDTVAMA